MRSTATALVLAMSLATSGCTAIGAAVGSSSARYQHSDWPREAVAPGTEVRVHVRRIGADAVVLGEIDGRYGGIRDGLLSVTDAEGRAHELPVRDVVELEVREGTQWRKGLLLGAAADAVVVLGVIAIANGANVSIATAR